MTVSVTAWFPTFGGLLDDHIDWVDWVSLL